jgi:hypothetical protein
VHRIGPRLATSTIGLFQDCISKKSQCRVYRGIPSVTTAPANFLQHIAALCECINMHAHRWTVRNGGLGDLPCRQLGTLLSCLRAPPRFQTDLVNRLSPAGRGSQAAVDTAGHRQIVPTIHDNCQGYSDASDDNVRACQTPSGIACSMSPQLQYMTDDTDSCAMRTN